eukprot:gene3408-6768_t
MDADILVYLLPKLPENAFENKVVWITGASSGIGASLAQVMTQAGARVIISARRHDRLMEVAANCTGKFRPEILSLDVTNSDAQKAAYESVVEKYGHIDILVLNAGRTQRALAVDFPLSSTREIMELNFISFVDLSLQVLPSMISRKSGHIVVVGSVSGIVGTPIASSYSASKFALNGYYESLRGEVAAHNITVTMVVPGPVATEMADSALRVEGDAIMNEDGKMSVERCVDLMVRGIYHRIEEIWISYQPFLLVAYMSKVAPTLSRMVFKRAMQARVDSLKTGATLFDSQAMLGIGKSK